MPDITGAGGIASTAALGSPQLDLNVSPSGIVSGLAFGTVQLDLNIEVTAISTTISFGSPIVSATKRWPTIARTTTGNHAPLTTIILKSATPTITCKAHGSSADVQSISLNAGAPGASGNDHPAEASATHWARCPTCDRLIIVVPGTSYAPISHRMDLSTGCLADSYLDETDPTTVKAGLSSFYFSGAGSSGDFPMFRIGPLPRFPAGASVIRAQLRAYCTDAGAGGMSYDSYVIKRDDSVITEATWNNYKSGSAWTSSGAQGDDTDRDTGKKFATARALAGGTGYLVLADEAGFRTELLNRWDEAWFFCLYGLSSAIKTFDSMEAGSNKPELRIWYEAPMRIAGPAAKKPFVV